MTMLCKCYHAEFVDSVREGDGDHVICCWGFLPPLLKSAARVRKL